ncbi:MAG: SCO family protein [Gammaproteobacteria bacterium]
MAVVFFTSSVHAIDAMEEADDTNLWAIPLVDATGKKTNLAEFKDGFILLNFMFTSCHDVCPLQTTLLVQLQKSLSDELKSKVQFVSITLDPEKDTAVKLMDHASQYGVDRRTWSFLTGTPQDIKYITRRFSAISLAKDADLKVHSPRVYLLGKGGHFLLSYRSDPLDVERVESDLVDLGSD